MQDALIIGAKFDADVHGESCRLAFYGRISTLIDPAKHEDLASIRVYKVCWRACKQRIAVSSLDGM